jgi:hypothetical protein
MREGGLGPYALATLLGLAAGAAALVLARAVGPGLEPDSMSYLGAAESLARSGELRVPWAPWSAPDSTTPLTDFPPGFSVALAAPIALGAPPTLAARWVMAAALAVAVGVGALLVGHAGGAGAAVGAVALLGATPAIGGSALVVMSEPLFFAWFAGALWLMYRSPERPLGYGLAAAGASLVRYAGVSLVGAGLVWAGMQPAPLPRRLRRAVGAALPGFLAQAAWAARGSLEHAAPPSLRMSHFGGLGSAVVNGVPVLSEWLAPGLPPGVARTAAACGLLALLAVVVGRAALRFDESSEAVARLLRILGIVAVSYVLVLLYARQYVGADVAFDRRLLAPLFFLAALGAPAAVAELRRRGRRAGPTGAVAVGVVWIALTCMADVGEVRAVRDAGYGYEGADWQRSPMARWIRTDGRRYAMFTNDPAAVFFLTGRPARLLPRTLSPSGLGAFAATFARHQGALLGFVDSFDPTVAPDSLAAALGLREVAAFEYGRAWVPPHPPSVAPHPPGVD